MTRHRNPQSAEFVPCNLQSAPRPFGKLTVDGERVEPSTCSGTPSSSRGAILQFSAASSPASSGRLVGGPNALVHSRRNAIERVELRLVERAAV